MHQWQAWLVTALLLFVAEMVAPGFWLLSVAVGCLAAGVVSLVVPGALVPTLSFAAGTLLSLVGIRPFLLKYIHPRAGALKTNVDALAGKVGIVSERIDTMPTLPAKASTFVLSAPARGWMYLSRNGRMPTSDSSVPAAKLSVGTSAPGTTSDTTPAARHPTATDSSQNPGATISATNSSSAVTSQACHWCMGPPPPHATPRREGWRLFQSSVLSLQSAT